jgi:MEDS: MEthanogen/methylotroph, DcmR Sensory domain
LVTSGTDLVLSVGPRDHIVFFYQDEQELAEQVASYLGQGMSQGGSAVAIATAEHEAVLAKQLTGSGVDLVTAIASGSYTAIDAMELTDRFVVGGWADALGFFQEASPLIRQATEAGEPVRVFGEIVSVLWGSGLAEVAIEVEAMWNELGRQYPFSLVCAYPTPVVDDPDAFDAISEICRAHVSVVGSPPPAVRGWRYH